MDVKVCKNCRRLFNYIYGPELCPNCIKLLSVDKVEQGKETALTVLSPAAGDESKFEQVRDYIMNNPKATVVKIAEVNDVTPARLFEWIREDRLEFSNESEHAWFTCEKCGTKIRSGRLCNRCKIRNSPIH
jgi:uncharacterized protein